MSYYLPFVLEQTHRGERQYDIWSRLLKDRIVFIGSPINDDIANVAAACCVGCVGSSRTGPSYRPDR